MFAIYKRELKSYFRSFIGLLFIAVTLFFIGLYFFVNNMLNGYPYFSYSVSSVMIMFFIAVPVLTMRILAEERKNKTDQLILTAPVSVGGIVMGKFLALLTIYAIPTAVICVYPVIMSRFGTVPMANAYVAILGFFLYGMLAIAIGVMVSSLTESQVISSVLTFIILFLMYMMTAICGLISSTGNLLTKLLSCLDTSTPYANMLNGTLDLKSVVYFVSMTVLALFLTVQFIQKRRYSVSAKNMSMGAYSTGMIAVMIAIIVAVNFVVGEIPASWVTVDVTAEKLYSLTDQTKEYVKGMEDDVTIYVIAAEDACDGTLAQTLQRYDDLSKHITVEYVDPNVNPRFFTQYTNSSISMNSLIVVSQKRSRVIDYSDIYASSFDYNTYSSVTTGYDGEGQITSALDFVLSDDMPKIYLTQGHGEYALSGSFTAALGKENVEYESISLLNYEAVPDDAACLVINAAGKDFAAADVDKIISYLERGGSVILVAGYTEGGSTPNLDKLYTHMGLELVNGIITEQNTQNFAMLPYYLLPKLASSVYTAGIYGSGQYYIFAPFSQGIRILDEAAEDIVYDEFMTTSDKAFSKTDTQNIQGYEKSSDDVDGPFAIGLSAVKTYEDGSQGTMVAFGCDQIFTDDANNWASGSNLVLFTNTVSSFVNHEVSVSVPVKSYELSYLIIPQGTATLIGLITVIIVPVGCLAAGFIIWFRRRKR